MNVVNRYTEFRLLHQQQYYVLQRLNSGYPGFAFYIRVCTLCITTFLCTGIRYRESWGILVVGGCTQGSHDQCYSKSDKIRYNALQVGWYRSCKTIRTLNCFCRLLSE